MPTYAYQCSDGHRYDLQQPFGSPKTHRCKRCTKRATRVVAGAATLVFKGSGFYKTDSRNGGDHSSSSSSSSSGSSSSRASSSNSSSSKASSSKASGSSSTGAASSGSSSSSSD